MITNPQQAEPHPGGPMSVEDYLQLDNNAINARYEYLDGVARLMSGGSGEHDQIAFNVRATIGEHFQSGPCFVRGSDMRVLVSEADGAYVYPDVTVSCDVADRRRGNKLLRSPRVVVEVLSPSTEKDDRTIKLLAYQAYPTIQEIVLISQFAPHVEIYRRREDKTAWEYTMCGPGSTVELTSVDVHLSMDEIYKHVNFDEPLIED
jgi:Uma2 family endonuclease